MRSIYDISNDIVEREKWLEVLNDLYSAVALFEADLVRCSDRFVAAGNLVESAGYICGKYPFDDGKIKQRAGDLLLVAQTAENIMGDIVTFKGEIALELNDLREELRIAQEMQTSRFTNVRLSGSTQSTTKTSGKFGGPQTFHQIF